MPEIKGRCLCGAVSYSANADPAFVGLCHCKDCQKVTGSAFSVVLGLPASAVTFTGETKSFTKEGDSGKPVERRFCPVCGTTLADTAAVMPDMIMIGAGTLDDPSWVRPKMQIYCDSAQPWVQLKGEMKSFSKMPA